LRVTCFALLLTRSRAKKPQYYCHTAPDISELKDIVNPGLRQTSLSAGNNKAAHGRLY